MPDGGRWAMVTWRVDTALRSLALGWEMGLGASLAVGAH